MSKMILESLIAGILWLGAAVVVFMVNDEGEASFFGSQRQRRANPRGRAPAEGVGDVERAVFHDGLRRTYLAHVPKGHKAGDPLPVLLAFHGGGGRASGLRVMSRLNQASDRFGFLVIYPNGTGRMDLLTFNAGTCCGFAVRNQVDDVGFIRTLLADLPNHYPIDPKRVYATGLSNGAMFSYRLACEMPDKIAGISPISGGMGVAGPMPDRPVPVIHFHGVMDQNVPFAGGIGPRAIDKVPHRPIGEAIEFWVKANHCRPEPAEVKRTRDYTMTRFEPPPGQAGAPVVLYALTEGGHNWPGGVDTTARLGTGKMIESVDASSLMWQFFESVAPANAAKPERK
jgi:polyhydroxybutyrate depolymerase